MHAGCARYDLDPAATAFIDDSAVNVMAARELGIAVIMHESADQTRSELARLGVAAAPERASPVQRARLPVRAALEHGDRPGRQQRSKPAYLPRLAMRNLSSSISGIPSARSAVPWSRA
jgi:FMN phosphatase YigB (HAD superfamily)